MAVVYRHIRLDKNEPFYIGIGNNVERAYRKTFRNKIWTDIYKKTEIEVEILFEDITREEALNKEKEFISIYGRINNSTGTLANLTDGGDGFGNVAWNKGMKYSDEKRLEMSRIAKSLGCKPPSRKGIKDTEETRLKKRQKATGKKLSEETKRKISESEKNTKSKLKTLR